MFQGKNTLLQVAGLIFDLFVLNLLALCTGVWMITLGISISAMYYVVFKKVEGSDGFLLMDFLRQWKQDWKRCILMTLFFLLFGLLLGAGSWASYRQGFFTYFSVKAIYLILWLLYLSCISWAFPIAAKFQSDAKTTLLNSLAMTVRHWPITLILVTVNVLLPVMFLFVPERLFSLYLFTLVFFGFSLPVFVNGLLLSRCFQMYVFTDRNKTTMEV